MRNERRILTSRLKGYMFEVAIVGLLKNNGFDLVRRYDNTRIRLSRTHFIELRGRVLSASIKSA
jgi:hypothetical protein